MRRFFEVIFKTKMFLSLLVVALAACFVPTPHDYTVKTVICVAELKCSQELVQKIYFKIRNGIPGNSAEGEIVNGTTYTVFLGGIWMGRVESFVDSAALTNRTTWIHPFFKGQIVRTFYADQGVWYSNTHGFGINYYAGTLMAPANQLAGAYVFRPMDDAIRDQLHKSSSR